jgi:prevent-host-death family protein
MADVKDTPKTNTRVTSAELVRNFSELADQALTEPLTITKNGRDRLVLVAAEEYTRLKRRDREVYAIEELPDDVIEMIANTTVDPKYDYLNEELKDWKP